MAKLELKFGDLFDSDADAVGHGTNTHGAMGAGIAVLFRRKYPEMYKLYHSLCKNQMNELAGTTYLYSTDEGKFRYVANIFSQTAPGPTARTELLVSGLKDAFEKLEADPELKNPTLAIPLIGCGIGGLDWDDDVYPALKELVNELPRGNRLIVVSNEPREGFTA